MPKHRHDIASTPPDPADHHAAPSALSLIEEDERGYPRSVLSRFTRLVGAEKLRRIIDAKVVMLLRRNGVEEVNAVLDASFIKA